MSVGAENFPLSSDADIDIRKMDYTDLKNVIEVEKLAYQYPWTQGIFRDCLRVGYECWVVAHQQKIIGYGIVMLAAGEAHILNLCIGPDYQRQGLGRKLLVHLVEQSRLSGADMVILEVRRSNQPAIELYQSENFHELGVRKAYYPAEGGREDAIIFAKQIG